MSTEQSLDPELVEQTKQQIRSLVGEIAQLSKASVAPEEFYGEFLAKVVSALAAVGGAVWTINDEGRLALQYQINIQETRLRDNKDDQARHGRLLQEALASGKGMLVPPHSGGGDEDDRQAANPTDCLLVLGPLKTDLETVGVVEVFQRSAVELNIQKGYLRFLMQMCELAGDFLKSHQLRHFSDRQVLWTRLEDFTHTIHARLDPRDTAYTIANEGRRLIDCDRVSVALCRGKRCRIEAISGQDLFDKRSNTVRLLDKLATAVVATGDPVWYAGDTRDMPPQVEDAVQEYVDESHSKTVAVLPLGRPRAEEEEDDPQKRLDAEPPVGALIVEQIEDSRVPPGMVQRVEVVCRHSSTALANAMEHQNLFLMPLWRLLGKTRWVLRARTLPKTLAVLGIILALVLVLALWPADFELKANGTLEPLQRRDVFAGINGVVDEVLVKHGELVKQDQLLVRLRNTDLNVAFTKVLGEQATTAKQIDSIRRRRSESGLSTGERDRLIGDLAALEKERESLDRQIELYKKKQEELEVRSPTDGQVITWDLYNLLIHRPIERGQVLMRIADTDGAWQLELLMSEDRMGHITQAQKKLGEELKVEFQLATDPATTHQGTVEEIHLNAEVRGEEGNTVLIKVDIDEADLSNRRPGAEVTAKVYCGRRSIGYCWFHDLIAFIQSRILF